MRISTAWSNQSIISSMLNQQAQMQQTQLQLATGKKILTPADNPVASVQILDLNKSIQQTEQYQNNINMARDRLSMEDNVLASATDILQRIRELGVQSLSDTNTAQSRHAAAVEMEALNGQLLSLANSKNPNGEHMFAGFKGNTAPFSKDPGNPGAYAYAGDTNSRLLQIDSTRQISDGDHGVSVFGVPTGASPAAVPAPGTITNVFEAVGKFAADLKANAPVKASLDDISNALDNVMTTRASIGARLNALDRQEQTHADATLEMKSALSATQDLDYTEAISRFSQQQLALQAAQQTFTQVKKLSLFNYM
jgi:flagellar hook-associated protein 3 FlgL